MNVTNQNQTFETTQLTSHTHNNINLNVQPPSNTPNIIQNQNYPPQINQTYNPNNTITNNPNISPKITVNPNIHVEVKQPPPAPLPPIEIKPTRTFNRIPNLALVPVRMICPFCGQNIDTQTKTSTNMKALCTAIGTLYVGFVCLQTCKKKEVSCDDCEHFCPSCGQLIGMYYAM